MVPYKECKSGQEPQQFTETKLTAKKFVEQGCTQVQDFFVTSFLDVSLQIAQKYSDYLPFYPGQEDNPSHEAVARVQERDQAELRHSLGDRCQWQAGQDK